MSLPILETDHLLLREITPADAPAVFANYSDPEVASWFFDEPYTKMEEADQIIQKFIEKARKGNGYTWAIVLKAAGKFIGTCSYEDVEEGSRGEIGFDLSKEHWGKGYMAEALSAVIAYGFKDLKLSTIAAHTYSNNFRARRVLEKAGFSVEMVEADSHFYTLSVDSWQRILE